MKAILKRFIPEIALATAIAIATFWAVNAAAFDRQTSRGDGVRVDVQPVQLAPGKPARFSVTMNTHTVVLSQDLLTASTLKDAQGRTYASSAWDGPGPGGHHRSGVLSFAALGEAPGSVTLVISGVAGGADRTFTWPVR